MKRTLLTIILLAILSTPAIAWHGGYHRGPRIIIAPPPIYVPPQVICRDEERMIRVMGSYQDVINYANVYGFRISRIVVESPAIYKLYIWETRCFAI